MALLIGVTFTICLSVSSMFVERNHQIMTGTTATSAVVQQMQVIK